jgi:hypothetical protein
VDAARNDRFLKRQTLLIRKAAFQSGGFFLRTKKAAFASGFSFNLAL